MIISRYITREVSNALFAVTFILSLAFLCQQTVRYLNYVAIGKVPTDVLLTLIGFEVPYLLAVLLPLGLFIGILLAYGRLYADNEMLILQMAGFGRRCLTRLTMLIAFFVSAFIFFLMLYVNPYISAERQQVMASDEATVHLVQTMIPGRFQVSPDGRHVMFVEKMSRDRQQAENVFLAQERKNIDATGRNAWMLVLAKEGYQEKDKDSNDQLFVTANGFRYEGIPGQNDYKIIQFKKYKVRIPQNDVRVGYPEAEALPSLDLWQDYAVPKSAAELQWRLSVGIAAFLLALFAIPLSTVKPRKSRYLALFPAVLIYIIYFNLLYISRHWVEIGYVPISIGMWWVHGLFFMIILSIFLFGRKRR